MICVNVLEAQYSKLIEQNTSYFSCAALFGFECNYDLYIVFKQLFYRIIIILIIYNNSFLILSPDSFQSLACILQIPVSFYSSHFSMLYRIFSRNTRSSFCFPTFSFSISSIISVQTEYKTNRVLAD